jgi:tetratricopeptide (TPR) repeat protein
MSEHELWNELGNLYFMSGAYNQAVHAYQRSIQVDAGFGRPYSNLALTYVQQGRYDEAIELYRRSIELLSADKEKAISWNRLGTVYRHLKDYSRAVIAFEEADDLDPQSADDFPATVQAREQVSQVPSSVLDESIPDEAAATIDPPIAELESQVAEVEPPMVEIDSPLVAELKPAATEWESLVPPVEPLVVAIESSVVELEAVVAESETPVAESESPATELESPIAELQPPAAAPEPLVAETTEAEPELEWWDIDESRFMSAMQGEPIASLAADDPTASWTPADPSQFQQDLSQMPETGSLTTWRETDFEDDFELLSPLDPDPDPDVPDPRGDDLSTWISIPEQEPVNLDELWAPPFDEDVELEEDLPPEWGETSSYHVISSVDFGPSLSTPSSAAVAVEYLDLTKPFQNDQRSTEQTRDQFEVEVDVEERPAPQQLPAEPAEPEPLPVPEVHVLAAGSPALERDEDEMREIEMGIAKFRRVVQVNPRNAHAWDALGTLFKSAGLYKDAILAYQQAISNDSSKSLYYHHLGLVYACEGRDEDAICAFQRVIEIDPEYSLAHATLGGYYRKMGLEELAQKHIGKAMKNIFDSENEYNRACLEAICGNADQAIELLGVALKNKQTYVDWILRDPDLDFIRQDPRFKQLISDYNR